MIKKKLNALANNLWNPFKNSLLHVYEGIINKKSIGNLKDVINLINIQLKVFNSSLLHLRMGGGASEKMGPLDSHIIHKIYKEAAGLHSLLPVDHKYSYSIFIALDSKTVPSLFEKCLSSLLAQTAPSMEILVGFTGAESDEIKTIFDSINRKNHDRLRKYIFSDFSKVEIINALASEAKGNYFLVVDSGSWLRPDFLLRYEQTLRLFPKNDKTVLYSDGYFLNESSENLNSPEAFHFPYVFYNYDNLSYLIPKTLWSKVNGLKKEANGAEYFDMLLRLNLAQAEMHKVPFKLFAKHFMELTGVEKENSQHAAMDSLKNYLQQKNLHWTISKGYNYRSLRAIPSLSTIPSVHVIIPFKDQKLLTLAAIKSVASQENLKVKITCVDNNSSDRSIGAAIELMGHEVLRIEEPFNYSRLNNLAVFQSKIREEGDLLFFMNNDVELKESALYEMCCWMDQPNIGAVGCRLNYPNGHIQFGGSNINKKVLPAETLHWELIDAKMPFDKLNHGLVLGIVDAVTGAAMLMKRRVFLDVGGFDEIWYPITFSDTNLCLKLKSKGLLCLYTPYSLGVHHESMTRDIDSHEDFVTSSWLNEKFFQYQKF